MHRKDFLGLVHVRNQKILWANDALHEFLGYDNGELFDQAVRLFFLDVQSYAAQRRAVYQVLRAGGVYQGNWLLRRKDGSAQRFRVTLALHGPNTELIVGSAQEDSKQTAKRPPAMSERSILSALHVAVMAFSAEGRFLFTNPAFDAMLGYPHDDLIDEPLVLLRAQTTEPVASIDQILQNLQSELNWRTEGFFRHKEGHSVYAEVSVSVCNFKSAGKVGIAVFREKSTISQHLPRDGLTQLRDTKSRDKQDESPGFAGEATVHTLPRPGTSAGQAAAGSADESARRSNVKALDPLRHLKREFIARVNHELRTPLHEILGFARLGLRHYEHPERVFDAFTKIKIAGYRLLEMIDKLLDFSQLEAGSLVITLAEVSLPDVIEQVVDLVRERASIKSIALRIERAAELPQSCQTDGLRLEHILYALLSNAVRFTEQGMITLTATLDNNWLVFRVTDTGTGMDEAELSQLFVPFQPAKNESSDYFSAGMGLSLAVSKQIAELLKGELRVQSAPGVGSTFELRIPYIAGSPALPGA